MRKNQTSMTAMGIAAARAIESEKPANERILYDPYARRFVNGGLYTFLKFFMKIGYAEMRGPGVNAFLMARERYIDDTMLHMLKDGLQQLVILGAGYDARAYRYELELRGVKVFEIDHPATQVEKLKKLANIFAQIPPHVTFVGVDFNTQSLETRLKECGYQPGLKTLFIWQGVVMYLTPEAVDGTLAFVCNHSAPGSAVVFDYLYQNVLDARNKPGEVSNMQRYRFMTGEGITFGLEQGQAIAFLRERGFREATDASAADFQKLYYPDGRKVAGGYGIAVGVV